MNYRILGLSGLRVSSVGLGCMGMSHAYGAPADRKEMAELLADAVDMGYTFFDTAESYGTATCPHDNEELLGEALKPFRNRTDHIDLYFQHRPDSRVEPEAVASVMADLIRTGKILHWGISEPNVEYLRRAHKVCPVTAIQSRYSMMDRWNESIFPALEELGIGFVAFSPLANGLLTRCYTGNDRFDPVADYRAYMPQFRKESFGQNKDLFSLLDGLAEQKHAKQVEPAEGEYRSRRHHTVQERNKGYRLRPRCHENE